MSGGGRSIPVFRGSTSRSRSTLPRPTALPVALEGLQAPMGASDAWDLSALKSYGVPLATLAICGVGAVYFAKRMSDLETKVDVGRRREVRNLNETDVRMIVQQMAKDGLINIPQWNASNAPNAPRQLQQPQLPLPQQPQLPLPQQPQLPLPSNAQQQQPQFHRYPTQFPAQHQQPIPAPAPSSQWSPQQDQRQQVHQYPQPQHHELQERATPWRPKNQQIFPKENDEGNSYERPEGQDGAFGQEGQEGQDGQEEREE